MSNEYNLRDAERDNSRLSAENDELRVQILELTTTLARVAVDVSAERTWCQLCRTEAMNTGAGRKEHPHDVDCLLWR